MSLGQQFQITCHQNHQHPKPHASYAKKKYARRLKNYAKDELLTFKAQNIHSDPLQL